MIQYDYAIVSAPALLAGVAGYGFSKLENKKNCVAKCVGFAGVRVSVIAFHLTAFASVVYAVFKSIVLSMLNVLTCNKCRCIKTARMKTDDSIALMFGIQMKKPPSPVIA